jgi:hypothetical protein
MKKTTIPKQATKDLAVRESRTADVRGGSALISLGTRKVDNANDSALSSKTTQQP